MADMAKSATCLSMPDSLYGARLQGFTVVVFIVAKSRAGFDEYIYHDSLQAHAIEGIGHSYSRDWSEQPRYVINTHSPLRSIQDGGRGNYEEAEGLFFENREKNQFAR